MSVDIKCPVCRAAQPMQSPCRRCGADLALFCKAIASYRQAEESWQAAVQRGDLDVAKQQHAYCQWMAPRSVMTSIAVAQP